MQSINVSLSAFEGPLDLLYHLIEKNEIDIYDIPIAQLTDQYLTYLQEATETDMEGMSSFLLMASTLLEIKSKMLLPRVEKAEEEGPDPREELMERLLEYKKYKLVSDILKKREEDASLVFVKEVDPAFLSLETRNPEEDRETFLQGVTLDDLYGAFQEVLRRQEAKVDTVRSEFRSVKRDTYTIGEKMSYLRDFLILHPKTTFGAIFSRDVKKIEVVVTFLALLELIKLRQVVITQDVPKGEIWIAKKREERL